MSAFISYLIVSAMDTAVYVLLTLVAIISSTVKVIFYPIMWAVDTVLLDFPTDLYALFQWSMVFKIVFSFLTFTVFLGVYAILFVVVLPWILCKQQVVWWKAVRHIQLCARWAVRILYHRSLIRLGILRRLQNRGRGAGNQPRDQAVDGGGQDQAVDGGGQDQAVDGGGQDQTVDGGGQDQAVDGGVQDQAVDGGGSDETGGDGDPSEAGDGSGGQDQAGVGGGPVEAGVGGGPVEAGVGGGLDEAGVGDGQDQAVDGGGQDEVGVGGGPDEAGIGGGPDEAGDGSGGQDQAGVGGGPDEAGGGGGPDEASGDGDPHQAAVRIPWLRNVARREERKAREQGGGKAIRVRRTPQEREEAIRRIEREAREQQLQRAMRRVRVPRERQDLRNAMEREEKEPHERRGEGTVRRLEVPQEAERVRNVETRELRGVPRRAVPQELDPDKLLLEQKIQREREMRENRGRQLTSEMKLLHDSNRDAWLRDVVDMGSPVGAGVANDDMVRRQARDAWLKEYEEVVDMHLGNPVGTGAFEELKRQTALELDGFTNYHSACGCPGARNGHDNHRDGPDRCAPEKNSGHNAQNAQRTNRRLEQNGDSSLPLPRQLRHVSALRGGSKQSNISNFRTPFSKKSPSSAGPTPRSYDTSKPTDPEVASMKTKLKELEKKLQREKELKYCVVCMDHPREVVIRPCNHYCVCKSCASRLPKCPVCTRRIIREERVYNI